MTDSRTRHRGIILAGGAGTRLYPATAVLSKQLLPVYDKPLIYYPLSVLMLAGIRDILIITTPRDERAFRALLANGAQWGLKFTYAVQAEPRGIAEAYRIGAAFIGDAPSALILGDNLFYGDRLRAVLDRATARTSGATIFGYQVWDPGSYGVVALDPAGTPISLEEKPLKPRSGLAIPGLYFYDERAVEFAERIDYSKRGELEITDLNRLYLESGDLAVEVLGRGFAWLDTGTHASMLDAAMFTKIIEDRQGVKICCPEEIAWRMGFIDDGALAALAQPLRHSGYGEYLLGLLDMRANGSAVAPPHCDADR